MNDGPSNINGLQKEWSLLVHSFLDQPENESKVLAKLNPLDFTLDQINIAKKDLSQQRRLINQKIETVKTEIEKLQSILENLRLVGSDTLEIQSEVDSLHQRGENLSTEISQIEQKIKRIHDLKDRMLQLPVFAT